MSADEVEADHARARACVREQYDILDDDEFDKLYEAGAFFTDGERSDFDQSYGSGEHADHDDEQELEQAGAAARTDAAAPAPSSNVRTLMDNVGDIVFDSQESIPFCPPLGATSIAFSQEPQTATAITPPPTSRTTARSSAVDVDGSSAIDVDDDARENRIAAAEIIAEARAACICTSRSMPCVDDMAGAERTTEYAATYSGMKQAQRIAAVHAILNANSTPGDVARPSDLLVKPKQAALRRELQEGPRRIQTTFAVFGRRLCRPTFARMHSVSVRAIEDMQAALQSGPDVVLKPFPSTQRGAASKGQQHERSGRAKLFIETYAEHHGLPDPTGRGSKPGVPVVYLPPSTTKSGVWSEYRDEATATTQEPITYRAFTQLWASTLSHVRIATKQTDFCETCARLLKSEHVTPEVTAHQAAYRTEREAYRQQLIAARQPGSTMLHLTFDFAERVYLPIEQQQPQQRYFMTALKFDFFGIYNACTKSQTTYGLTEGHWQDKKTCNTVLSMLHTYLDAESIRGYRTLRLHADNCGGQNKNHWMPWYFAWRVIVGLQDTISMTFLIPGHTKNACDGHFGLIKRKIKTTHSVLVPAHMCDIIAESSANSVCKTASDVTWLNMKQALEQYFDVMPDKFNDVHVFDFDTAHLGKVGLRDSSGIPASDTQWMPLLKKGVTVAMVKADKDNFLARTLHFPAMTAGRKTDLTTDVINRYFVGDWQPLAEQFFKDGSEQCSFHPPPRLGLRALLPQEQSSAAATGAAAAAAAADTAAAAAADTAADAAAQPPTQRRHQPKKAKPKKSTAEATPESDSDIAAAVAAVAPQDAAVAPLDAAVAPLDAAAAPQHAVQTPETASRKRSAPHDNANRTKLQRTAQPAAILTTQEKRSSSGRLITAARKFE